MLYRSPILALGLCSVGCLVFATVFTMKSARTQSPVQHSAGLARTEEIYSAAKSFLAVLDDLSRTKVSFPYESQDVAEPAYFDNPNHPNFQFVGEKYGHSMWSNFPVSDVPRPGVRLGDMTTAQHDAAMNLLRAMLSEQGYRKIQDIMGSDQALAESGVPYAAGIAAYTIAIFGEPSLTDIWMVQFGGHHLALNVAIYRSNSVLAPVLTGALPANYLDGDEAKRALSDENDKGFALYASLDEEQREKATISQDVSDLIFGPGDASKTIPTAGIEASLLDSKQQSMLFDLISEWAGILNHVHAAPRLQELQDDLERTYFAWSGPSTHEDGKNGKSYFRIHGPNLLIEFSPQFPGGDLTMHVHTIYRDPLRAYGRNFIDAGELSRDKQGL